jgi:hypothetical protein
MTLSKNFKRSEENKNPEKPYPVFSIEGLEKVGKTHWSLTAPGPIAFFDFDGGLKGVAEKFDGKKEIWVCPVRFKHGPDSNPISTFTDSPKVQRAFREVADKFKAALFEAAYDPQVKTIVIDTFTQAWEVFRLATFGSDLMIPPTHYRAPNQEFTGVVMALKDCQKYVILIHRVREIYKEETKNGKWTSKPTGTFGRQGYNKIGDILDIALRLERHEGIDEDGNPIFEGLTRVMLCRPEWRCLGLELPFEDSNFEFIMDTVYGEW